MDSIQKTLKKKKMELGSWQAVADALSKESGISVSSALIWKVGNGKANSPKVKKVLGMTRKRYRRSADLGSPERLEAFDKKMDQMGLSLSDICNGILDGTIFVSREVNKENITHLSVHRLDTSSARVTE